MTFPVYFHVFGHPIPAHAAMELIAYTGGFQLYLYLRSRQKRAAIPAEAALWLVVGAGFGALIGARLLAWIESAPEYWAARHNPLSWMGGKTIVGGLLGGWAGVEWTKRLLRIRHSTGDLFVFPLIFGMCVGRVGCFLTGLPDHTYGIHTSFPWGVNFGDGPRHPTQLYEIAFLLLLAGGIAIGERLSGPGWNGSRFRIFLLGYLTFRFFVEFIKPRFAPYGGLSAIQLASLCGAVVCATQLWTGRGLDAPGVESAPAPATAAEVPA